MINKRPYNMVITPIIFGYGFVENKLLAMAYLQIKDSVEVTISGFDLGSKAADQK